jgi:large subunit ribosomal protein L21
MYAVVDLKWHQYIVKEGDTIVVDNMSVVDWEKIELDSVLAVFQTDWKDLKLWAPYVKNAVITVKVVETTKGEKIDVVKFKRKNRYERHIWFRALQTVLQIESVKVNG